MSIKLRVTTDALKSKAGEVENHIKTLEKHFNEIQDIVGRSAGYWVGVAGDKARNEFNNRKEDVATVINRFREHPSDLLTMAGIYDQTDQSLSIENQSLDTDVIA